MEQKVIIIEGQYLGNLNKYLEEGWKVEHIAPFTQSVSKAGTVGTVYGDYGAYVVLQKKKKELTEEEVRAKLMSLITEEEIGQKLEKLKIYE